MPLGFTDGGRTTAETLSPQVWRSCEMGDLVETGDGSFILRQFDGSHSPLPGLPTDSDSGSTFTFGDGGEGWRTMDIGVTNTDNNAAAMFTRPLGRPLSRGSDNALWMEVGFAPDDTLGDSGFFIGFAENAGLDRDVVADDPGTALGLAEESLFGFASRQVGSAVAKVDAVVRRDNGTIVVVAADVLNSSALGPITGVNGVVSTKDLRADIAANVFRKYGVVVDGARNEITFWVDGRRVATQEIDSTIDSSKEYGAVVAIKTGAAAAATYRTSFFGAAARRRV